MLTPFYPPNTGNLSNCIACVRFCLHVCVWASECCGPVTADYNPSLLFKQPGRSEEQQGTFMRSPSDNQRPSRKIQRVVVWDAVIFPITYAVLRHAHTWEAILEHECRFFSLPTQFILWDVCRLLVDACLRSWTLRLIPGNVLNKGRIILLFLHRS